MHNSFVFPQRKLYHLRTGLYRVSPTVSWFTGYSFLYFAKFLENSIFRYFFSVKDNAQLFRIFSTEISLLFNKVGSSLPTTLHSLFLFIYSRFIPTVHLQSILPLFLL